MLIPDTLDTIRHLRPPRRSILGRTIQHIVDIVRLRLYGDLHRNYTGLAHPDVCTSLPPNTASTAYDNADYPQAVGTKNLDISQSPLKPPLAKNVVHNNITESLENCTGYKQLEVFSGKLQVDGEDGVLSYEYQHIECQFVSKMESHSLIIDNDQDKNKLITTDGKEKN